MWHVLSDFHKLLQWPSSALTARVDRASETRRDSRK